MNMHDGLRPWLHPQCLTAAAFTVDGDVDKEVRAKLTPYLEAEILIYLMERKVAHDDTHLQ